MFVGEIGTREVSTCGTDMSALEMAKIMRLDWLGDLVVTETRGGETVPVGIVTDRDLVTRVMAMGRSPGDATAAEIMSSPLITEYEGEDVQTAFHRLKHSHVRRIPLVDSAGALVGIVSLEDMAKHLALQLPARPGLPQRKDK
jgi:CBS domain-containing protein